MLKIFKSKTMPLFFICPTWKKYKATIVSNMISEEQIDKDIQRYRELHSWFKKLDCGKVAYPLFMFGNEERHNVCQETEKEIDVKNIHLRLVFDSNIKGSLGYKVALYEMMFGRKDPTKEELKFVDSIIIEMKKFPVVLDKDFGGKDEEMVKKIKLQARRFLERIKGMEMNKVIKIN